MFDLSGRKALVTGASGGIGEEIARILHAQGATVGLHGTRVEKLETLANELGERVHLFPADLSDRAAVKALGEKAEADLGGVDILVNNAGITGNCPASSLTPDIWNRVVAVNQTGTLLCALAAGERMRRMGGGVIINLSSIYGLVAAPNRVAYSATKAAVIMMSKALAVEWAADGVRVNCVAPGYVETPGTAELADAGTIDLVALRRRTPQQRLATPDDIAGAILSFCEDRMAHVTGQVLAVDGGWSAYGYL